MTEREQDKDRGRKRFYRFLPLVVLCVLMAIGPLSATMSFSQSSGGYTLTATTPPAWNNKARANSYDDAWRDGPNGWVANAKAILAGGTGQTTGLVLWIGDSLTRDPSLGAWAQNGAGKTAEDQMITNWMHAGLSPQSIDSIDGFALATPYICSARSYTVGDGLGSWDFMGGGMPDDTNPTTARQKLQNCSSYPNALSLTTILSAIPKAQFAIPEVNLDAANPGSFPDFQRMVDLLISKNIVPIIITYTYRGVSNNFNSLVEQYNTALIQYARTKKLPLIDLNNEMLGRSPFSQWTARFLSGDDVHYTTGSTQYPSTADPYAGGGDPTTHTTGPALTYNGYGLKGWLGVQKMKEIKQFVIDNVTPPTDTTPPTLAGMSVANLTPVSSTISWISDEASDSQVEYCTAPSPCGTVTSLDSVMTINHSVSVTGLTPNTNYYYWVKSKDGAGNLASSSMQSFTTPIQGTPNVTSVRIYPRPTYYSYKLIGGTFQGSNNLTTGYVDLATINLVYPANNQWNTLPLNAFTGYRYFRFLGPSGTTGDIAELEFYNGTTKLTGTPFGSAGSSGNDYTKAFDGNTNTFFSGAASGNQYVGIDTGFIASPPPAPPGGLRVR